MSKKYVPSFIKDNNSNVSSNFTAPNNQPTTSSNNSGTRTFWSNKTDGSSSSSVKNQFAAFSDKSESNSFKGKYNTSQAKPIINTSLPAKEAPKLIPATLASLTSVTETTTSGITERNSNRSFASKFAEKIKINEDPNYTPPPKPIDFSSEDDFPTLGAPSKPLNIVKSKDIVKPASKFDGNFAVKAREWADLKKAEEEAEKKRKEDEARRLKEERIMESGIHIVKHTFGPSRKCDSDDEYLPNYDEEDSDDPPSLYNEESEESYEEDEENEDGEYNSNIADNRRHKNDLY